MERQGRTPGKTEESVEKVRGEEKCGKEREKSGGNSSCCPSLMLLLRRLSDGFLLFDFAHSPQVSEP